MAERITQLIRAATGGDRPARGLPTRFAEQIPTSPSTVSRWRGGTVPDPEFWPALARVLNVTETEIAEASGQVIEPTITTIDAKLDQLLELVQKLVDRSQRRRRIERDETPAEMPRPVLKGGRR